MIITKEILEAHRAQLLQQRDQAVAAANCAVGALNAVDNALAMLAAPEPAASEPAKSATAEPTPPEKTAHSP